MQSYCGIAGRLAAVGALLAVAGAGGAAAQETGHSETTLLGVTLLKSSYRDVLKKYGRPDEIQVGGPFMPSGGTGGVANTGGPMMGGGGRGRNRSGFPGASGTGASRPMMSGMSGGQSNPGMGGGLPGFPGSTAGMGSGTGSSMFGRGGQSNPGMSGMPGGMSGMPGGMSGMSGMPGRSGMSGMGTPGAAVPGGAGDQLQYEATWWYHDPMNGLHKSFLFNKDGRVIQVQEYGYDLKHKGGKTSLGVGLGSGFNQVLRTYGWSNDSANSGTDMIMRFGGEDKVAFQLVNNVVRGITIAVVKSPASTEESDSSAGPGL